MEEAFKQLYEQYPQLKEEDEKARKWREEVAAKYVQEGFSEEEALRKSWDDYWKKAKEESGVEISFHEIKRDED